MVAHTELQQRESARGAELEVASALAVLLQQKAEQLQQAQQAAAGVARSTAAAAEAVAALQGQLAAAQAEAERLRGENAVLSRRLATAEEESDRLRAGSIGAEATAAQQSSEAAGEREAELRQRLEATEARCAELEAANGQLAAQAEQVQVRAWGMGLPPGLLGWAWCTCQQLLRDIFVEQQNRCWAMRVRCLQPFNGWRGA